MCDWKRLAGKLAGRRRNERCGKSAEAGLVKVMPKTPHYLPKLAACDPPCSTYQTCTTLVVRPRSAEKRACDGLRRIRRVRHTEQSPRFPGRRQRSRHAWIGRKKNSRRRSRRQLDITRFKGGNAIVFFIPGLDAIPTQIHRSASGSSAPPPGCPARTGPNIDCARKTAAVELLVCSLEIRAGSLRSRRDPVVLPVKRKIAVKVRDGRARIGTWS